MIRELENLSAEVTYGAKNQHLNRRLLVGLLRNYTNLHKFMDHLKNYGNFVLQQFFNLIRKRREKRIIHKNNFEVDISDKKSLSQYILPQNIRTLGLSFSIISTILMLDFPLK